MSEQWLPEKLGRTCYIKARIGWRGLSSSEYTEEGPLLVAGQHIRAGRVNWDACDHISEQRFRESHEIILRPGDVILTKDGTIGRVARIDDLPKNATINGTMMLVRPLRRIDYRFLYHVLTGTGFQKLIDDKVSGSSIPHIFQRDMVELEINLPELSAQSKIAEILDTLDDAIRGTEAVVAKLAAMKQGLLHDLLTRGIDQNGDLRPPYTQAPHLYHQTPLGWLPKEWELGTLKEYCSRICVGIVIRPSDYYVAEGVTTFRSANIREGHVTDSDLVYISPRSNAVLHKSQVRRGDILTVRTGYPGTSAVVPEKYDGCNCVDILISTPTGTISSEFLCYWINSPFGKGQVLNGQGGVAQQHFNVGEMRELIVVKPNKIEQDQITSSIGAIQVKLETEQKLLKKLRLQKSGLMADLLTGRVSVAGLLDPEGSAHGA